MQFWHLDYLAELSPVLKTMEDIQGAGQKKIARGYGRSAVGSVFMVDGPMPDDQVAHFWLTMLRSRSLVYPTSN